MRARLARAHDERIFIQAVHTEHAVQLTSNTSSALLRESQKPREKRKTETDPRRQAEWSGSRGDVEVSECKVGS